MTASLPLVSCIMPTAGRRSFVPHAIRYFLNQDYSNKELVIVDDGRNRIADLVPDDPQVRYFPLDGRYSLGAKRNICVEHCQGDLILHWDDDDWSAPSRICCQAEALLGAGAEVCGLRQMLFYEVGSGQVWLYSYPPRRKNWLAGGSLLYTRAFWRRSPFPNVQVASDTRFVMSQRLDRAVVLPDYRIYVALIHPGNTSPKHLRSSCWTRWSGDLGAVMGEEAARLAELTREAGSRPRALRPTRTLPRRKRPVQRRPAPEYRIPTTSQIRVTVSIPYWRCKQYIRKAVESILRQTHSNLALVVVNDGDEDPPWDQLAHIHDPRLFRFELRANYGRYFADGVVLNATTDPYFLVQDADDWSEPNRIAALLQKLRADDADAAVSAWYNYRIFKNRTGQHQKKTIQNSIRANLNEHFQHRFSHYGLFKTETLRNIGGYYAGFRIGYDTLLMNLLMMTGRVTYVDKPLYNRLIRHDSLVNSRATGLSSPARYQAARKLQKMYEEAYSRYRNHLTGSIDSEDLISVVRQICAAQVDTKDKQTLKEETDRLRNVLCSQNVSGRVDRERLASAEPLLAPRVDPLGTGQQLAPSIGHLIDDEHLKWAGWSIGKTTAIELAKRMATIRPRRVLELGTGNSTAILAACAALYGLEVLSLEHDKHYYGKTMQLLEKLGLLDHVNLKLIPLQSVKFFNGAGYPWYSTELTGKFDFVFVDSPPERYGRQAVLFALSQHLNTGWELWLHDGNRPHELNCIELWKDYFQFSSRLCAFDAKGVWILGSADGQPILRNSEVDLKGFLKCIGITMLTGNRLGCFKRTVNALRSHGGLALKETFIVAMVNGNDGETRKYLDNLGIVDKLIENTNAIQPVGVATSLLMHEMSKNPLIKYILHLEDDWEMRDKEGQWLKLAHQVLENNTDIGQVRLRHSSERVLNYHMVTKKPIVWQQRNQFLYSKLAHFTFNPSLIRVKDVSKIFPCVSEADAQRKFLTTRLATAQLLPGAFFHIGVDNSLRARLNL